MRHVCSARRTSIDGSPATTTSDGADGNPAATSAHGMPGTFSDDYIDATTSEGETSEHCVPAASGSGRATNITAAPTTSVSDEGALFLVDDIVAFDETLT